MKKALEENKKYIERAISYSEMDFKIDIEISSWMKWKDNLCLAQSLSNVWFHTYCSLDYESRLIFYNELKTISSLFLLLAHQVKTIEELSDNIITYMYYVDDNKLREEYGKYTNTDPFIDQFKSTLSNYKIQYKKGEINSYKEGSWFFSTINYDTLVSNSFGKYLEQIFINQMKLTDIKYDNIKMIVPPKIIVLSSDQKDRNGCIISNEFILFGNKYILIGAIYNQNKAHFITIVHSKLNDKYINYQYDGMKQNGNYIKLNHEILYSKLDENKLIVMTIYVLSNNNTKNNVNNNNANNNHNTISKNNTNNNVITETIDDQTYRKVIETLNNSNNDTKNNANNYHNTKSKNNANNNAITETIDDQKYRKVIETLNNCSSDICRIDLENNSFIKFNEIIRDYQDAFKFEYYVKEMIVFRIVVNSSGNTYSLEIACDQPNCKILEWVAGDRRFQLLKTFFIEMINCLYYLKITKKLHYHGSNNYNPFWVKKEILFSIERNSKIDTFIEKELFKQFSDIGFYSKKKDRHYTCNLL